VDVAGNIIGKAADGTDGSWSASLSVDAFNPGQNWDDSLYLVSALKQLGYASLSLSNENQSFSGHIASGPFHATVGAVYNVNMFGYVSVSAFGQTGCNIVCSASVTIDPTITLDPSVLDPEDYAIVFSPGVNNTPLPATLPLFAGGLGMIGLIAGRKKRKAAGPATA
jgi:hypothetical protein